MTKDLVCGMIIGEGSARFKLEHEGEIYYFCCEHCKVVFEKNPNKFVKSDKYFLNIKLHLSLFKTSKLAETRKNFVRNRPCRCN